MRNMFKLPFSLDINQLDVSINLTSSGGTFQLKRQITLRVLFVAIAGILLYIVLLFQTPFGLGSGFYGLIVWTIGYFWLLFKLCVPTLTKQIGMNQIRPMWKYLKKTNKQVFTKRASYKFPVEDLVGIAEYEDNGKIYYANGDVGCVFEVVGNASILMFDADRDSVLISARNFWRKVNPNVSVVIDSVTAPQRVNENVVHMADRFENLKFESTGLRNLIVNQAGVLDNFVGQEFKSLHQYMIVRATNNEALHDFENWMQIQNGSQFLKSYRLLKEEEGKRHLRDIYTANPK